MSRWSVAVAVAVIAVILAATTGEAQQMDCASKLVPCYNDLNTTTKPSDQCCSSIREAVQTQLPCLCTIYTTPGLLAQFGVTTDQALGLSKRCDVNTDLSACNAITGGAPSPAASLPPPRIPGGPPGGPRGAAGRTTFSGITALILIWASVMFY